MTRFRGCSASLTSSSFTLFSKKIALRTAPMPYRCLKLADFRRNQESSWAVFASMRKNRNRLIAIDGKVLRRSFDKTSSKSPLHMVSVWGPEVAILSSQSSDDLL
jgi:hypothetical protein